MSFHHLIFNSVARVLVLSLSIRLIGWVLVTLVLGFMIWGLIHRVLCIYFQYRSSAAAYNELWRGRAGESSEDALFKILKHGFGVSKRVSNSVFHFVLVWDLIPLRPTLVPF